MALAGYFVQMCLYVIYRMVESHCVANRHTTLNAYVFLIALSNNCAPFAACFVFLCVYLSVCTLHSDSLYGARGNIREAEFCRCVCASVSVCTVQSVFSVQCCAHLYVVDSVSHVDGKYVATTIIVEL